VRLVQKLSLAFLLCTAVILATNGYFRVGREVALLRADRVRDHDLIARVLVASVAAVWRSEGAARAMQLVDAATTDEGRIRIRWVWLEPAPKVYVDPSDIARLAPGATITRIAPGPGGNDERFTYAPLRVDGRLGALELSEGLANERSFAKRAVADTLTATAALTIATTLVSYLLGVWFVGRPIRELVEKARRIGRGEFGGPVHLAQHDEIAELAREMNVTSERLIEAREGVARETAARIATLEQLRHADRLTTVGKLASGVAHELGTPLNVVAARAEMIAAGETSAGEAREYANIIVESARKMTTIIRQLLEFARRRGPAKEPSDIARLALRTLELLRPLAARQRVTLAFDEPAGPQGASVDAGQIEQALTNLIINAVQAMKDGGTVHVSVLREHAPAPPGRAGSRGADEDWIAVRVRDEGQGIEADHLPHVFEPFFTTKDVGSGTGLGLSVAHGIVQDHGGWFDVSSELGRGSTFTFFLPVQP
jgi:two-component system NtrC family sensor kinase